MQCALQGPSLLSPICGGMQANKKDSESAQEQKKPAETSSMEQGWADEWEMASSTPYADHPAGKPQGSNPAAPALFSPRRQQQDDFLDCRSPSDPKAVFGYSRSSRLCSSSLLQCL